MGANPGRLILVPVNMASSFFIYENMGLLVALLAIGGMTPNLVIWIPLVIFLIWIVQTPWAEGQYLAYLWLLLAVDALSLAFDIPDTWKWMKGDRAGA
ncbi:MAG: hypothetical protein COB39_12970 [Marinosulfonomonas sp.]|nr:MAG: hypothetical protein COB39_12970 [Marinosulfonomonas sp.]